MLMAPFLSAAVAAPSARRRSVVALVASAFIVALPVSAGSPAGAVQPSAVSSSVATATTTTVASATYKSGNALGDRVLRRGKKGSDVKELQKLLSHKQTGTFNKTNHKKVKMIERSAGQLVNGVVGVRTLKAIKAHVRAAKSGSSRSTSSTGTPSGNQQWARSYIANQYGWGSGQMSCLVSLWNRESGWRHNVSNPNGRYHGIPQTSSAVWGAQGYSSSQYMNNPEVQIKVGARYIKGRYGTPCGAWSFWQSRHWY